MWASIFTGLALLFILSLIVVMKAMNHEAKQAEEGKELKVVRLRDHRKTET
ncbi:hypothetical protein [Undibacterium oligocarboniphilum]|uniref:Uncharacterized protein n=1 Tax=Undibacterium oligocarboniphilum TaxID=666702 RepID=A0A850QDZ7_9BURK|nr:hypothetical protein [Undibacterium oligocarboniphilum]MBC3869813.1 hypothetical protein [Undibacterium oligocarboniphilum]NVO77429.1 hypothetical protein [Undibacterium oligocarboniphilum]